MRGHDDELIHDVVNSLLVLAPGEVPHGILGVERLGHVQPVEPHLVRVDLLVPESPVGVAGLRLQLGVERVERHLIAHVSVRSYSSKRARPGQRWSRLYFVFL